MSSPMVHLNGNLLCAIDVETTGLKAGYHDMIQVCVLPLGTDLKPLKTIPPFYTEVQPKRPETIEKAALKVNGLNIAELMEKAIEPYRAAELFENWFEKLNLAWNKKIAPLGQNYPFDRGFLMDWLGEESYSHFFDYHIRDTATAALYLNDRAGYLGEECPLPKVNLTYLASQLEVPTERAHDALQDCLTTAEVYRRMLRLPIGFH